MDGLSGLIRKALMEKGASVVGFADLKDIAAAARNNLRYGISIGVALNPEIVRNLENGPTKEYYAEYKRLNKLLDELDEQAAGILADRGFNAFPQTSGNVVQDKETFYTALPHKTVATRAGLGWIGKCALLVTKEFGSAVRISSVLTDAELETAQPVNASKCGNCDECRDICPGNAVVGADWSPDKIRDEYYNVNNCARTARELCEKIGLSARICGKCIYACPWTKKYLKNA